MFTSFFISTAPRKLELADPRLPIARTGALVILLRVPERAVVGGVNGEHRIVAPTRKGAQLRAAAAFHSGFALGERIQRVSRKAPGVKDAGIPRRRRSAETDGEIALLVQRRAAHPAPRVIVGQVGALLINRGNAAGHAQFVPANPRALFRFDGVIQHERFVRTKIAVL